MEHGGIRLLQVLRYAAYMKSIHGDMLAPSQYQVMLYLMQLSDELKSPTSVFN